MSEGGFAELLRELKDRSGHSYGTLAKRLHMSTSTLHRYCNGDAVPADYAPVERLARLCKATPGELVDLHRRWVLADAGRGRKAPEPGQGPRGPGVDGRGRAADGREPGADGREPAPERGPESGAEPVAGPRPSSRSESVAGSESAVGSEPGTGAEPVAEGQPVTEAEQVAVAEPVAEGLPGPAEASGSRRGRRSRTVLLTAALTVTALLGGVAVALNLPSAGGKQDGKGVTAARVTAETAARDSASPKPSTGSPTPRRSAARSSSPSPRSSATDGVRPAATPPRASASARTSTAPPLTVATHPYAWENSCSQHYLIDRPPADVSPPPLEQDAPAWVDVHQAVSAGEQYVTFTVQGTGEETVVLEGLSVRMAGKRSPLAWNDYAMGYPGVGCGGGVPTRSFTVALDAMRPAPVPEAGSRSFPFKVSQSDPEVFHVTADASAYDVSWYLELAWSSGDRHGTLVIDDAGRPFRTSGNNGRPAYAFPLGGEKWRPASDAG
jgi:hypothetical protein